MIKIDENFKPIVPSRKQKNNEPSQKRAIPKEGRLPVASSWNPDHRVRNYPWDNTRKTETFSINKVGKAGGESNKTSTMRSIASIQHHKSQEKQLASRKKTIKFSGTKKDEVIFEDKEGSIGSERTKKQKNPNSLSTTLKIDQINSVESSDASAILEEILGDESNHLMAKRNMGCTRSNNIHRSFSQSSDPIFKSCRELSSSEYAKKKASKHSRNISLYNQALSITRQKNRSNERSSLTTDNDVPFKGSAVEWKVRKNAQKIKRSSLEWGKRGYKFGCALTKEVLKE